MVNGMEFMSVPLQKNKEGHNGGDLGADLDLHNDMT